MTAERRKVGFPSAGSRCAAWHYPGDNGACVIMADRASRHQRARYRPLGSPIP